MVMKLHILDIKFVKQKERNITVTNHLKLFSLSVYEKENSYLVLFAYIMYENFLFLYIFSL